MRGSAFTGRLIGLGIALTAHTALSAELGLGIDVKGLVDLRGVVSSSTRSWEDGGLGKTRYGGTPGGDRRVLATGEATLLIEPRFGWDLSGFAQLTVAPEQHTSPDIVEAYLQYKPAPRGPLNVRVKAGVFFPPISLENTGLAWTSPYAISSSAINSWVGEELRTIGAEATVLHRTEDIEVALTGALYKFNDPTGTLLAWRGWTISDRKAGLLDHLNIPAVPSIRPGGRLDEQLPYDQPFKEIDERIGYYAGGRLALLDYASLSFLRYDNLADDRDFEAGQWPWGTSFWSAGATLRLAGFDLIGQGMTGKTTLITTRSGPLVYADFEAAYGLVSRAWGKHRVSLRYDWFATAGKDFFRDITENGDALTFAYIFRPKDRQRLTFEMVYIDSDHSERQSFGLPARVEETQFQISYRFFF